MNEVSTYAWAQPKPKPENVPDGMIVARCGKCGGNGRYVMSVINGQPWSATGTTCYNCGGAGWITRRKPAKKIKCEKCGSKVDERFMQWHDCETLPY